MNNRIGRYEIQAELGRGGFGRVFRAFDPTVGRMVAIKTLNTPASRKCSRGFAMKPRRRADCHHSQHCDRLRLWRARRARLPRHGTPRWRGYRAHHCQRPAPHSVKRLDIISSPQQGCITRTKKESSTATSSPPTSCCWPTATVKIMDFGIALADPSDRRSHHSPRLHDRNFAIHGA